MWTRAQRCYDHDLWIDARGVGGLRRGAMHMLRPVIAATRGFRDPLLNLHALGLVYTTLLSLVPFLAVTFSVLKAFGAHYRLDSMLAPMLAPLGPQAGEATRRVVEFVSRMNVGVLGGLGVAGLFYTAMSLVGKIEDALNHIWQVRRSRDLRRKFSDYLSVLLVGPVLIFTAFGIIASLQSSWLIQRALQILRVEKVAVALAGDFMPFLLLVAAFTFVYRFLLYTRVALSAAALGGVTAAVLWELVGLAFSALVASSTSYAAVYSSFAVVILCLIWLQAAWLVVLIGAQVAYAHQHPVAYAMARRQHGARFQERIGLTALVEITRRYLSGQFVYRLHELSRVTDGSIITLEKLTDALVERGILARTSEPEGVTLSRPPEDVMVVEILDTIHDPTGVDGASLATDVSASSQFLRHRDQVVRAALGEVTLRTLASQADRPESTVADLNQYRNQ